MSFIVLFLFIIMPLLGFFISLFCYFFDKTNKRTILYSLLVALFLGLMAYKFIPPSDYDLFRHHLIVRNLIGKDFSYFLNYAKVADLEFLSLLICYIVAFFKNVDLLQFLVVFIGYFLIFYILRDYRNKTNIKMIPFILICSFTLFSFNALSFISGLWNYLAIIIFSFSMYNEYEKKGNKVFCYFLYGLTLLLHNSMIFPLAVLIIYKSFKNKLNIKSIIVIILLFITPTVILNFINNIVDINVLKTISNTYNSYFTHDAYMYKFYGGKVFIMEMLKLFIILLSIFFQNQKSKINNINGYIFLLTIAVILMIPKSIVMIRFIMLIQFVGIVPMINSLEKINRNKIIYIYIIIISIIIYILYFIKLFHFQNFGDLFSEKILTNIFNFF